MPAGMTIVALLASVATLRMPDGVSTDESGRLVATKSVTRGAVICQINHGLVMSKDSAQETSLLTYLDPVEGPAVRGLPHWAALPDEVVITLQLGVARAVLAAQRPTHNLTHRPAVWQAWLQVAAATTGGTLLWTTDERSILEGSQVMRFEQERAQRAVARMEVCALALS